MYKNFTLNIIVSIRSGFFLPSASHMLRVLRDDEFYSRSRAMRVILTTYT